MNMDELKSTALIFNTTLVVYNYSAHPNNSEDSNLSPLLDPRLPRDSRIVISIVDGDFHFFCKDNIQLKVCNKGL